MSVLGVYFAKPRHLWIIGAIIAVIGVTIFLRRLFLYIRDESIREKYGEESEDKKKNCREGGVDSSSSAMRSYRLDELRNATKNFRDRIGVGATSFVYSAELGNGKLGAVKRVMEERGGSRRMFLDEVSILLRVSHPNLVGLMGFCLENGEQLLLLEHVPNKSLFERMHTYEGQSYGILSWSNRLNIALHIARALNYLHSEADPPIIHRDVKSSNVLSIDNDHAKLTDFGLCKLGHDLGIQAPSIIKGSIGYTDTHYLTTGEVSSKSDVYSFGVLLLELITGLKSVQGSVTLAEWTENSRKSGDVNIVVGMLDPKLQGNVDVQQIQVLIAIANSALLENSVARPTMTQIMDRLVYCLETQSRHRIELPV
ncbi:calmodulin-binding receptor-like cytoplasmic kinase 2 [Tasmannia lanceolata]|uniref:calmodulin-binding receptor-like cytoplasmic kinase 2 n=1 Tax=Tasmannia lanceolata TaxID=3420 RepID=UPI00406496E7